MEQISLIMEIPIWDSITLENLMEQESIGGLMATATMELF